MSSQAPDPTQNPPIYFANVVTMNLTVDELAMEFRRFIVPHHRVTDKEEGGLQRVAPPSAKEVMQESPVARVVLTYTAAKMIKQYLDAALPEVDKARRAGTDLPGIPK